MSSHSTKLPAPSAHARSSTSHRAAHPKRHPSDDEILGLVTTVAPPASVNESPDAAASATHGSAIAPSFQSAPENSAAAAANAASASDSAAAHAVSPALAQLLESHPELRDALASAQQFRAIFPTPAEALDAKNQLAELDELFFSAHPANHAALAARIHELSPAAFHGLAHAMQAHAAKIAAAHAANPSPANPSPATTDNTAVGSGFSPDLANGATQGEPEGHSYKRQNAAAKNAQADPMDTTFDDMSRHVVSPSTHAANPSPTNSSSATADNAAVGSGFSPDLTNGGTQGEPEGRPYKRQNAAAASAAERAHANATAPHAASPDPRRAAQLAFFHSANAAAVQQIISSIESHVNHLLPESVSAGTKTRIVGEIYRDLDSALRSNHQLVKQLREAFHSAAADAANPHADTHAHQRAIVALVTGRAKQALPSIAKRVINEWTHSVVAANHERLARHHSASARVDISGAGASDGVSRKPISPRELDYHRLSDSDILNL